MRVNNNQDNGVYNVHCTFISYDGTTIGLQADIKGFMGAVAYAAKKYCELKTINGVFISKGKKRYKIIAWNQCVMAIALTRWGWKRI